jgi:RNA polymerase sigma-70 factor (ECF subfamily)
VDFDRLFEDEFDGLYGYLARRAGPFLARDLAAEAFTRAYAGRKNFDARRGEPRAWLFGIANNVLRRHYRDEERRLEAISRVVPEKADDPPEEPRLASALGALSRGDRDSLLLFAWAGLSYEEIAIALDVPLGTVRSRIHRARASLRDVLTREEAIDG